MGIIEIDDRGRITIPKEKREKMGFRPGQKVIIREKNGDLVIRKAISVDDFIKELKGCVAVEGDKIDPLKIKGIWEPKT